MHISWIRGENEIFISIKYLIIQYKYSSNILIFNMNKKNEKMSNYNVKKNT